MTPQFGFWIIWDVWILILLFGFRISRHWIPDLRLRILTRYNILYEWRDAPATWCEDRDMYITRSNANALTTFEASRVCILTRIS